MTPGLFDALHQRKKLVDKAEYLRAGIVASAVVNSGMCRPEEPVEPQDFMPTFLREEEKAKGLDLTSLKSPEEVALAMKAMMGKKKYSRRS